MITPLAKLEKQLANLPSYFFKSPQPSTDQKVRGVYREIVVQKLHMIMDDENLSLTAAANHIIDLVAKNTADVQLAAAMTSLARKGKTPDASTILRWANKAKTKKPLVGQYKGQPRKHYGWEGRFLELWQIPTKPELSVVVRKLIEEGYEGVTYDRVRNFSRSLPESMGDKSKHRMGELYHKQNLGTYKVIDYSHLKVGQAYQIDGHTCDVYVKHPNSGKHFRPELTMLVDIRSRYIVGYHLSFSESAVTTIHSMTHVICKHNHVPDILHCDRGSGYKAAVVSSDKTGMLLKLGINTIYALPKNAKGKGIIERLFREFERSFGVFFEAYCGHCRTDDAFKRFEYKIEKGLINLVSLEEYAEGLAKWVESYNNRIHGSLGVAPASLWQQLRPTASALEAEELARPHEERTVVRGGIKLNNRLYRHPDLLHHNGRKVIVAYDLNDDQYLWVYDQKDAHICTASLAEKEQWLSDSRLADLVKISEQRRLKLLDKKAAEIRAQSRAPIEATAEVERLDSVLPDPETDNQADSKLPKIDIYDLL